MSAVEGVDLRAELRDGLAALSSVLAGDTGWVYVIQQLDAGPVKIGRARSLPQRLGDLQSANPYKLTVRAEFKGPMAVEQMLHSHFARYRLHGEWFLIPDEELTELTWILAELHGERRFNRRLNYDSPVRI